MQRVAKDDTEDEDDDDPLNTFTSQREHSHGDRGFGPSRYDYMAFRPKDTIKYTHNMK